MGVLLDFPQALAERRQHAIFSDFTDDYVSTSWVSTLTDSGTAGVGDAAGGIMALVASDGTVADNDEAYLESPNETFLFANNKPLLFEARIQFTEANTDDANIIVGMKDAVAADTLLDNGGGPAASYTGAVFFKVDGGTNWQFETSISGAQTTTDLTAANANNLSKVVQTAGGASYQTLRISFEPYSSTAAKVNGFIDGVHVVSHDFTYTSATEMQLCAGVKNGGANVETLNIDYMGGWQLR